MITKEDLPEELINSIMYRAKNGFSSMLYSDERDLQEARQKALDSISNYKEMKKAKTENDKIKEQYTKLLNKIEG